MRNIIASVAVICLSGGVASADPLPSWNNTASEQAIISFVESVTDATSDSFVPVADRIAVFDNDGTLWAEQPLYFQGLYALDKVRELGEKDPSLLTSDTLKAAADGDMQAVMAGGKEALLEVFDVSHSGVSVEDFKTDSLNWLATTKHPTVDLTYGQMTYQPMLELLSYLRDNGFTTYIVSGGGIDFIRAISEDAYGIPPAQVVGSEGNAHYEVKDGVPTVIKDGGVSFIDDKAGKPVGIERFIGKRPIFAGGNSDGDFQMLEWVTTREGPSFGMLVHHTDADREFAYDREGHVGVLSEGQDQAADRGWVLVDMKNDWNRVWSSQK